MVARTLAYSLVHVLTGFPTFLARAGNKKMALRHVR